MKPQIPLALLSFLLVQQFATAQLSPGGQYPQGGGQYPPGGGYPSGGNYPQGQGQPLPGGGIPMPRWPGKKGASKKSAEKKDAVPTATTKGMLRRLDEKLLTLEAEDHRIVRFELSENTKYKKSDLKDKTELKTSELKPGDHLTVESVQDEQGYYFALNVIFEKAGSEADRASANVPDEILKVPGTGPSGTPEDERPHQKRAGSKSEEKADKSAANLPAPLEIPEDNRPRTVVIAAETPSGVDGEAPPKTRRGRPAPRKRTADDDDVQEIAVAKLPPLPNGESRAESEQPQPRASLQRRTADESEQAQEDPLITKARETSESYTETLPNYIATQNTTRYVSTTTKPSWQAQDIVSAEVIYEAGKERYRNLSVNGKKTNKSIEEIGGSWSTGEFASVLIDVFARSTNAVFHSRGSDTLNNRATARFDFFVNQQNSHWTVHGAAQSYRPAYKGAVWIDKETGRVLRIEMQSRQMPQDFPFDKVEMACDYDFVRLGTMTQFLLPVHSENLNCQRGSSICGRNTIDFRNYKKFGSDSTLILK